MRIKPLLTLAFVLTGTLAYAQDPPSIPAPTSTVDIGRSSFTGKAYGSVDFGARFTDVTGDEARFQRYRDLRPGVFGNNFVAGKRTEDYAIELQAWNIGYRDQKYQVDLQRVGRLKATFFWDQIPLFISRDTRTLFEYAVTAPGVFRLEDSMQQEIQAGNKTLRNYEDQATRFDMKTLRKIGDANLVFAVDKMSDLSIHVKNTMRQGQIPFGGTFGLNNAVELPVPVDWRITDVQTSYERGNARGMFRFGVDGSIFDNSIDSVTWDNPLRFGPDLANAPSQGRADSWASNTLTYFHGTGAISMAGRSRLTAYAAIGRGRQNQDLLPFTINTAIAPVPLSRPTAEAERKMSIAQLTWASRPWRAVSLNAKYRYSDVDVTTPVFQRPGGTVQYDGSFSATADPSEYFSVKRSTFDADGAFELAPYTSLKIGYSIWDTDYQNRIFEKTKENVFRASVDTTGYQYLMLRAVYEDRVREGEGLETEPLIEAGEGLGMRHFDIANRDRKRFTFIANVLPAGKFGLTGSAGIGRDDYPDTTLGLQSYDSDQYSAGFSIAPDDRYQLTASYGWERYKSLQQSRNATTAADQDNPLRSWTTNYTGKVNFLEAALDLDKAIQKTQIRISADWNRANDTYLYGLVTGSPLAVPDNLPPVKNELLRGEVNVTYDVARNIRFGVAYWYDDYNVQDFALGPTTLTGIAFPPVQEGQPPNTATNALLLGYLYRPYTAHAAFVRLTYLW